MPRVRQPTDVVLASGSKHLSTSEEFERRSHEAKVPGSKNPRPPAWLDESLKKEFRKLGKQLAAVGLYTDLDADVLGMYLTNRHQWEQATREAERSLFEGDLGFADKWTKVQERLFKAARNCGAALGLDVSSRCRLVIPQSLNSFEGDDEMDEFTLALIAKQRAAGG